MIKIRCQRIQFQLTTLVNGLVAENLKLKRQVAKVEGENVEGEGVHWRLFEEEGLPENRIYVTLITIPHYHDYKV